MNNNYILPKIKLLKTINQDKSLFTGNKLSDNYIDDFKELYEDDFLVVIAEPGDGKSRLLKEIALRANEYNKSAIYINLKKIPNRDIQGYITVIKKDLKKITDFKNINEITDYFFSDDKTPVEKIVVCLDALDEVARDTTLDLIEEIKKFKQSHPQTQIILSCRDYIYNQYDRLFEELNPKRVQILSFGTDEINKYLSNQGFTDEEVNETISHFNLKLQSSVINSPRILEIFVSIKEKEDIKKALNKSKSDLLESFVYGRLKAEDKKENNHKKELVKRVLDKLALTMEIYQASQITKDELMTFFDDISSNLAKDFLQQIQIDDFYERFLLAALPEDDKIQFQNNEFQEYLAAKEITRLGRVDQIVFDLIINKDVRGIYPSWANTLKYLLELYPPLILLIIKFICRNNNIEDFYFLERILTDDVNIINKLPVDERENIFNLLFKKYQDLHWYLSGYLASKMSFYFVANNTFLLESYIKNPKNNEVNIYNSILVANYLLSIEKLPNKEYWQDKCIKIINNNSHDSLIVVSLKFLSAFKDLSLLKDNFDFNKKTSGEVLYQFIWSCIQTNPNDKFTIDLIIKSIKERNTHIFPQPDFNWITSNVGIKYFLNALISDAELLRAYETKLFDNYIIGQIIKNIDRVFDEEIKDLLKKLIFLPEFYSDNLLKLIIELLQKKENNILIELIGDLRYNDSTTKLYQYRIVFEMLLTQTNAKEFLEIAIKVEGFKNQLLHLLWGFKFSPDEDRKKIFEISKEYFEQDYNEITKDTNSHEKEWNNSREIYDEFRFKLKPNTGEFISDVFSYYISHKNILSKYIQQEDLNRIKEILLNTILKFDFSRAKVLITKQEPYNTSFSSSQIIQIFSSAFPLFTEFNIEANLYKKKLLEFLPFAFLNDYKTIFNLLGDLSDSEVKELIKFYQTERQDDLFKTNIKNLFYACTHYKLIAAIPVLKNIIKTTSFEIYKRKEALDILNQLDPDFDFYKEIFSEYSKKSNEHEYSLAITANEYLIKLKNPYRKESIIWRIKKIIKKPIILSATKSYKAAPADLEFQVSNFNNVLMGVADIEFLDLYLNMLDSAINLYKKGTNYQLYAAYTWNVVLSYFENLIFIKSFEPLKALEKRILNHKKFKGYTVLFNTYNKLKLKYLNALGKPANYYECIKKYNKFKDISYNNIAFPEDFYYLIEDIINVDIKKWVEMEGAYRFMSKNRQEEELIQKTIKTQFENGLLKRGLRDNEVNIRREEQLLDNDRTDFVISYGFIGQILIEIKLAKNPDVKKSDYPRKLKKYIAGTKSDYGIFLIFQTDKNKKWSTLEPIVKKIYSMHNEIKVIGLNCYVESLKKRKK